MGPTVFLYSHLRFSASDYSLPASQIKDESDPKGLLPFRAQHIPLVGKRPKALDTATEVLMIRITSQLAIIDYLEGVFRCLGCL